MFAAGKRPMARRLALVLAAVVIAVATLGATLDADPAPVRRAHARSMSLGSRGPGSVLPSLASSSSSARCGPTSASTIGGVDATVAQGIYAAETHSREVNADIAHITGSQALLSALASNSQAAVRSAVHGIVYAPHWHIVRLRVVKAGRVVADVGGPDVLAPVSGALRWKSRTLGTYVMSVQDDLGYVKLVTRFIGVPVDLYRNGSFLMGTLQSAPPTASSGSTVDVGGTSYRIQLLRANAFPSGTLRVALLVPTPAPTVSATSCSSIRLAAWGSIAMHIAARLKPLQAHYQDLVGVLHRTTGGFAYVLSGSRRIAGGAVPARIPRRGIVRYDGRSWSVFSWEPVPPARIYFLTPSS
jgi:hypothetical protein